MKTVLFSNCPWWSAEPGKEPGKFALRQGIRAGSRWPFTTPASFLPDRFKFGPYLPFPWFMGSAAGYLQAKRPDLKVVFRDSIARGESYQTFISYLNVLKPDFLIVEVGAASWDHDLALLLRIKELLPFVRIAVAGPSARDLSQSEKHTPVSAWLLGEYDKNSLLFIEGASGVVPFNLLSREEMKNLPFPMFDEVCITHYADGNPKGAMSPELTVWASRGCMAVCNFCTFPASMTNDDPNGLGGRKIRFYDDAWLESFILQRIHTSWASGKPLASVRFDGDTENASDRHTLAICEVMRRIGIPWSMMCRADTSAPDVWRAMAASGCFGVKLGFESGSDRIVNQVVKKNLDLKAATETALFIRGLGMSVHGTFMIGHPTETPEEVQMTLDFIKQLYEIGAINSHQLSGTAVLAGSPLSKETITDPNFVQTPDGNLKAEKLTK